MTKLFICQVIKVLASWKAVTQENKKEYEAANALVCMRWTY